MARVLSMSNMQNAYGSNMTVQDLFDGPAANLAHIDVFELVDVETQHPALLEALKSKLRDMAQENQQLKQENARLKEENDALKRNS